MPNIFEERDSILPYEYPDLLKFVSIFHNSFWEVEHFKGYERDVKELKTELNKNEQKCVTRCMLAISSIENHVKTFWGEIHNRLPKPEVAMAGFTISANEVVHQLCYQKLLEQAGLESEFSKINDVPCMLGRAKYLKKYREGVKSRSNKEFTKSLILFTLLVENVSLFSQFYIVSCFYKYTNRLVNFSDIIGATLLDEGRHGNFGAFLINIIRKENPEWFDQDMEDKIRRNVRKAYKAEVGVLDWIFESGDLSFVGKEDSKEFLKSRFNDSLSQIGYGPEYELDDQLLEKSNFMNERLKAVSDFDFFYNTSSSYAKATFDEQDIW